jgi:predicted alpha/beta-fold hydrolase
MSAQAFQPPALLRNPHLQSFLASSRLRGNLARKRFPAFGDQAEAVVLDCGQGVRLLGFHSRPADSAASRGMVVLIHGWEGCADSSYMLAIGGRLQAAGYEVFRLQLRDHGDTHHLNEELFHSCRLDEVVGAVAAIAARYPARPMLIGGFSLGGNFSLRVAQQAQAAGLPLVGAVAVCPPIDPRHTLEAIEHAPFMYEWYFIRKWTRSLKRKQALYPDRYRFEDWLRRPTLRDLTNRLVLNYTDFGHLDRYLNGYSIAVEKLADVDLPITLVAAADDPVIPVRDFHALVPAPRTELLLSAHGGHCGFIQGARLESWIEELFLDRIERYAAAARA